MMATEKGGLAITWYGQAGLRIVSGLDQVLVDPFLSDRDDRAYPPPVQASALVETELVLCTHEHEDHLDLPFLKELFAAGARPFVVVPAPVRSQVLEAGLPADRVLGAEVGVVLREGGVVVHPVAALHGIGGQEPVVYGFTSPGATTQDSRFLGYVIDVGGQRLYHAGDTLVYPGLAATLKGLQVEVVFLPINGRDFYREVKGTVGNMNEDEAAMLAHEVGARMVVPIHYDGFADNLGDLGRFASRVAQIGTTALLLLPRGVPVVLTPPADKE